MYSSYRHLLIQIYESHCMPATVLVQVAAMSGPGKQSSNPKDRIRSSLDYDELKVLVKAHLKLEPSLSTGLWKADDIEEVVDNYKLFLLAIAQKGSRLSKTLLLKVLRFQFESEQHALEDFAQKLVLCQRHCWLKVRNMASGCKLSSGVRDIASTYKSMSPNKSVVDGVR